MYWPLTRDYISASTAVSHSRATMRTFLATPPPGCILIFLLLISAYFYFAPASFKFDAHISTAIISTPIDYRKN